MKKETRNKLSNMSSEAQNFRARAAKTAGFRDVQLVENVRLSISIYGALTAVQKASASCLSVHTMGRVSGKPSHI